ncbi:MAG: N-acetylglucosamine-6-phosphate deacetylase [Flexilinea sp.]
MNSHQRPVSVINGSIILSDQVVDGKTILISEGKVTAVTEGCEFNPEDYECIDAGGKLISPGLIDLHIHGCLHHTFNEANIEAFEVILSKTLSCGITTLLPTLVSAPITELCQSLEFIRNWKAAQKIGMTQISGAYLESPYIAPAASGALPSSTIRTPDDGTIDHLLEFYDAFSIFMIAPELPGAIEAIKKIISKGIIAAMGHSMAIEKEITPAIDAGASHVTHLWSAMSSVVRHGPWRQPGLLEVALTNKSLTAEIIADNRHLPPTLMKLAIQSKKGTLCAVSDALNGAGLPEGSHFSVGDQIYEVEDGVGMVPDHSCFAGSTTLLNREIPVLINEAGLSLPDAIRMVTEIPAKIARVNDRIGSIKPGYDADIVIFNEDFTPFCVIQKGNPIFF